MFAAILFMVGVSEAKELDETVKQRHFALMKEPHSKQLGDEPPSRAEEKFTDTEIQRIHRQIARMAWQPSTFYDKFKEAAPNLTVKTGDWKTNISKVISESSDRRIPSKGYHRGAIAKLFGMDLDQFDLFLLGQYVPGNSFLRNQVAAPVPDFKGREQEKAKLVSALTEGSWPRIAMIYGLPGAGKTQLARSVAHEVKAAFPHGQLVFSLPEDPNAANGLRDELERVMFALLPERAPNMRKDIESLKAYYLGYLTDLKVLVMVDNAQDLADVEPIVPPTGCGMIVTSRPQITLAGRKIAQELKVLLPHEAVQLLESICATDPPIKIAPDICEKICRYCGYLPLAIRLIGDSITRATGWKPDYHAQKLEEEHHRLEALDKDNPINGIQASFNWSYSVLSGKESKVFRSLSIFPASFDRSAEAAICDDKDNEHLRLLVLKSLVSEDRASERFVLHDLMRLFATERLGNGRDAIAKRHAGHFLSVYEQADKLFEDETTLMQGAQLFAAEKTNILSGWRWAAEHAEKDKEAARLCGQFASTGPGLTGTYLHPEVRSQFYGLSIKAAKALGHSKEASEFEATALRRLARSYHDSGQKRTETIELLTKSLELARSIPDRTREQAALSMLGRSQMQAAGNDGPSKELALQNLLRACELAHDIDPSLEIHALGFLGSGYLNAGKPKEALARFEAQLDLARKLHKPRGEANALNGLGMARYHLDRDKSQAIALLEDSKRRGQELGDLKTANLAADFLGKAYEKSGQLREALDNYMISQSLNHELGNRKKEGAAFNGIGRMQMALGDWESAEESFRLALSIARQVKSPTAEFYNLKDLANLFGNEQPAKAIEYAEAALAIDKTSWEAEKLAKKVTQWHRRLG